MNIEVQFTTDCPHVAPLIRHLQHRPDLTLTVTEVRLGQPVPDGFCGSPTVLIDGHNPFGGTPSDTAACALHPPSVDQIDAAISA